MSIVMPLTQNHIIAPMVDIEPHVIHVCRGFGEN
jgi:hypothetical protein